MHFDNDDVNQRLTKVFRKAFRQPDLVIQPAMTASDVAQWDSLSHIDLITAIEKEFKFRFTTSEIMSLNNVGDLDVIVRRKAKS